MTVMIAGAGITGLTLGLSLHQAGIAFHIYEAVREIRPLGVGLSLQPMAVRELFELGLESALDQAGLRTEEVGYFNRHGQEIWSEPRGQLAGNNWPQYSIHRGKLQMLLLEALIERAGADVLSFGAEVVKAANVDGRVEMTLRSRESGQITGLVHGDVLVAADGINSALRAGLFPDEGPAVWGGTVLWRGVTKGAKFRTGRSMVMIGTRPHKFICYPIADTAEGGSLINWIAELKMPADHNWLSQDWNRVGQRADFADHFKDWRFDWLDVPDIIDKAESIWEFPMVDRDPVPIWSFGIITLLGDAAHPMYPIGSNGTSQGILDARILTREICEHGVGANAFAAYENTRLEAVNAVVLANRADGPDTILDIADARAPDGFDDIETVIPLRERQAHADRYKAIAGMTIETLNAQPAILENLKT